LEDPERFSRGLENRWRRFHSKPAYVSIDVPAGLSQDEASEYFLKKYIREGACQKRGAGASVRSIRPT